MFEPANSVDMNSSHSSEDMAALIAKAKDYPTPASRDYRSPNAKPYSERGGEAKGEQLANFVCHSSLPAQPTESDGENSSGSGHGSRRRLNPAFVCLLMTWPWWWTQPAPISFAPLAMASWQSRARRHLSSWLNGQGSRMNSGLGGVGMSSWPTITSRANTDCPAERNRNTPPLESAAVLWTTLLAHDEQGGNPHRAERGTNRGGCANLADEVTAW